MALSVDSLYKFSLNLIRKNQAGGLTSTEFNRQWNDSQSAYQDDLLGRFQARSNGKTGLNTGLVLNETISQKLSPFTKLATLTIASGASDKPTDLIYRLAVRINGVEATKINHGQIAAVNDSVIDPPSIADNKYYYVEYEDYYKFLPIAVTSAELDYISTAQEVLWGYTFDADGRQVYNPGTSIQSKWDDNSNREITKRMLVNLGVSFHDNDFSNFGKSVVATGE